MQVIRNYTLKKSTFFQVRPAVCIVSTTLQRYNVLAHDLRQRAEISRQKARTPELRTRIDTEILRIHGSIPPTLLILIPFGCDGQQQNFVRAY